MYVPIQPLAMCYLHTFINETRGPGSESEAAVHSMHMVHLDINYLLRYHSLHETPLTNDILRSSHRTEPLTPIACNAHHCSATLTLGVDNKVMPQLWFRVFFPETVVQPFDWAAQCIHLSDLVSVQHMFASLMSWPTAWEKGIMSFRVMPFTGICSCYPHGLLTCQALK